MLLSSTPRRDLAMAIHTKASNNISNSFGKRLVIINLKQKWFQAKVLKVKPEGKNPSVTIIMLRTYILVISKVFMDTSRNYTSFLFQYINYTF